MLHAHIYLTRRAATATATAIERDNNLPTITNITVQNSDDSKKIDRNRKFLDFMLSPIFSLFHHDDDIGDDEIRGMSASEVTIFDQWISHAYENSPQ